MSRSDHDPQRFARESFSLRKMKHWQIVTLSAVVLVLLIAAVLAGVR
jgi:hypothetical protein